MPTRSLAILWSRRDWMRRRLRSYSQIARSGEVRMIDRSDLPTSVVMGLFQPRARGFSLFLANISLSSCFANSLPSCRWGFIWHSKLGSTLKSTAAVRDVKTRSRLGAQYLRSFLDSILVVVDHQCVYSTRSVRNPYGCVQAVHFARGHRMGRNSEPHDIRRVSPDSRALGRILMVETSS